jgi:hypothetical protein
VFGQSAADVVDSAADGAVHYIVAYLDLDATDELGFDHDVESYGPPSLGRQRLLEPVAVLGAERRRDPDNRDATLTSAGGQLADPVQRRLQRVVSAAQHHMLDQLNRLKSDLVGEEPAD